MSNIKLKSNKRKGNPVKGYSGKGGATQRSYSGMSSPLDNVVGDIGNFFGNVKDAFVDKYEGTTKNRIKELDKKILEAENTYRDAKALQGITDGRLMAEFPNSTRSLELRDKYESNLPATIDSNSNYKINPMLKKGGYLKDKNTYVTKDGRETRRGLWANVFLKNKKLGGNLVLDPTLMDGGKIGGFLQNIAPALSLIPGGQALSPLVGMAGSAINQLDQGVEKPLYKVNQQLKMGGEFKQYNAPSHQEGGQMIDLNGNPNPIEPAAEIEKQENSYNGYVYSDHLKDGDKTFADKAKKINRMTNRNSDIDRKSKILQLARLKAKNDLARQQEMSITPELVPEMQGGGNIYGDAVKSALDTLDADAVGESLVRSAKFPQHVGQTLQNSNNVSQLLSNPANPLEFLSRPIKPLEYESNTDKYGQKPTLPEEGLSNLNKLAAIAKGVSLAGSAVDALRPSEQEKLQLPDYSRGDQYVQDMSMDFAPQLAEINRAATKATSDVSDQVSSIGQRSSRVAGIQARAGQSAASAQLNQQQANNRIKQLLSTRADRQSEVGAQERTRQQTAQSQNDATSRLAGRKFLQDLSQVGTTLNQLEYAKDQMQNMNDLQRKNTMYGLYMLAMKNPNFKPSQKLQQAVDTGNADPAVIGEMIEFAKEG